jgi:hypothetical protein
MSETDVLKTRRYLAETFNICGHTVGAVFRDIPPELLQEKIECLATMATEFRQTGQIEIAVLFEATINGLTGKPISKSD